MELRSQSVNALIDVHNFFSFILDFEFIMISHEKFLPKDFVQIDKLLKIYLYFVMYTHILMERVMIVM